MSTIQYRNISVLPKLNIYVGHIMSYILSLSSATFTPERLSNFQQMSVESCITIIYGY